MKLKEICQIERGTHDLSRKINELCEKRAEICVRLGGHHCPGPGCYIAKELTEDGHIVLVVQVGSDKKCTVKVPEEVAPALAQALSWLQEKPEEDEG